MNSARMKSIEDNLTGIARKVYDLLPIQSPATVSDLCRLMREKGNSADLKVIHGCLGGLVDQGLARELNSGSFQRIALRPALVSTQPVAAIANEDQLPRFVGLTPLERLANLEKSLRGLADEAADLGITVEEFVESIRQDNAKVNQLKELLKNL